MNVIIDISRVLLKKIYNVKKLIMEKRRKNNFIRNYSYKKKSTVFKLKNCNYIL